MDSCEGKCDCGNPSVKYHGPHDPDCRSLDKCDGERGVWCEKHWQKKLHEHGWMRGLIGNYGGSTDGATQDRMRESWADRIDMARMRMKDGA